MGPLDLLLDMIKKQEIGHPNIDREDPRGQYLEYLTSRAACMDTISFSWRDFIYMAATLHLHQGENALPPDPLAGA